MCLTDLSNDQLVKDEGAQIFYSIRSKTKPIGIGANCENPSQSLSHIRAPTTQTYDRALIPLVRPCALPIDPTTNWWRIRGHKSFIAFDRRPSPLVFERIVKIPHNNYISNQETLLQSPCKNKIKGGGNEFNTYTGCPYDLSSNINFSLFTFFFLKWNFVYFSFWRTSLDYVICQFG